MTQNTAVAVVVPNDIVIPDYMKGEEAAAAIAAANAAAASGSKGASYPRVSIEGGKFHLIDGDEDIVLMNPPAGPGQPPLPMMLLRVVLVASVPKKSKILFLQDWQPGKPMAPDCSSVDGTFPDAHIAAPQHSDCATCPQNKWGSKISKFSGKEIKACDDYKQIVILPADDLQFKALGFKITKSELTDWDDYVNILTKRGLDIRGVITNITFDTTASHPKVLFSFGGTIPQEQWEQVKQRAQGDDVLNIVMPAPRAVRALALPAPAAQPQLPPPAAPVTPPAVQAPVVAPTTAFGGAPAAPAAAPTPPAAPVPGFGGAAMPGVATPGNPPAAEPEKPKRAPRKAAAPAEADPRLAHLTPDLQAGVVAAGGPDSAVGKMILAANPAPAQPAAPVAPAAEVAPVVTAPAPAPAAPPAPAAAAPAPSFPGAAFGGAAPAPAAPAVSPAAAAGVADIRAKLAARIAAAGAAKTA